MQAFHIPYGSQHIICGSEVAMSGHKSITCKMFDFHQSKFLATFLTEKQNMKQEKTSNGGFNNYVAVMNCIIHEIYVSLAL